jgi:hypothetical protein
MIIYHIYDIYPPIYLYWRYNNECLHTTQELKEYKALSAKVKCFIEAGKEELIK